MRYRFSLGRSLNMDDNFDISRMLSSIFFIDLHSWESFDTVVELDISKRASGDLPKILNALPVED